MKTKPKPEFLTGVALIEHAVAVEGRANAVAKMIGVANSTITAWRNGRAINAPAATLLRMRYAKRKPKGE